MDAVLRRSRNERTGVVIVLMQLVLKHPDEINTHEQGAGGEASSGRDLHTTLDSLKIG